MKKILPLLIAAAFASPVAMAHQAGDILVRGGLAFVSPQTSSDNVLGTGVSIHRNSIDTGKMRRSSLDPTFLLA